MNYRDMLLEEYYLNEANGIEAAIIAALKSGKPANEVRAQYGAEDFDNFVARSKEKRNEAMKLRETNPKKAEAIIKQIDSIPGINFGEGLSKDEKTARKARKEYLASEKARREENYRLGHKNEDKFGYKAKKWLSTNKRKIGVGAGLGVAGIGAGVGITGGVKLAQLNKDYKAGKISKAQYEKLKKKYLAMTIGGGVGAVAGGVGAGVAHKVLKEAYDLYNLGYLNESEYNDLECYILNETVGPYRANGADIERIEEMIADGREDELTPFEKSLVSGPSGKKRKELLPNLSTSSTGQDDNEVGPAVAEVKKEAKKEGSAAAAKAAAEEEAGKTSAAEAGKTSNNSKLPLGNGRKYKGGGKYNPKKVAEKAKEGAEKEKGKVSKWLSANKHKIGVGAGLGVAGIGAGVGITGGVKLAKLNKDYKAGKISKAQYEKLKKKYLAMTIGGGVGAVAGGVGAGVAHKVLKEAYLLENTTIYEDAFIESYYATLNRIDYLQLNEGLDVYQAIGLALTEANEESDSYDYVLDEDYDYYDEDYDYYDDYDEDYYDYY